VEHVVESQTQCPPTASQRWPLPQLWQAAPAVPQEDWPWLWQWLPEQHPEGQEAALHWQVAEDPLPTQRWSAEQAGPVPQPQLPSARHWFEVFAEQLVVHALPLMPQLGQTGLA
jgi:hypothetical protein